MRTTCYHFVCVKLCVHVSCHTCVSWEVLGKVGGLLQEKEKKDKGVALSGFYYCANTHTPTS